MKNIECLSEKDDIHGYMEHIWRTPEFQRSHAERGFVFQVVEEFASLPRFFFDISDEKVEPSHFSSWWGGIQKRVYDNPAIQDLYYIHELSHAGTMIHLPGLEYKNFSNKMFENELLASVRSEIQVYFELPTLREKSFPHEIFADRFLQDPKTQDRWSYEPKHLVQELSLIRRNVMTSQTPRDLQEYWIHKYAYQNDAWASIWFDRYNQIETAMGTLRDKCRSIGRKKAQESFISWLTSPEITAGSDIPFPEEARAFAGVYWKNKRLYAEAQKVSQERGWTEVRQGKARTTPAP